MAGVAVDLAEASEGVLTVDVHGARATDALAAAPAEGDCLILFILFVSLVKEVRSV